MTNLALHLGSLDLHQLLSVWNTRHLAAGDVGGLRASQRPHLGANLLQAHISYGKIVVEHQELDFPFL
jgi:hypothetical protein